MVYDDLGLGRRESRAVVTAVALIRAALDDAPGIHVTMGTILEPLAKGSPEETWDNVTSVLATVSLMAAVLLDDLEHEFGVDLEAWFARFDVVGPTGVLRGL